MPFDALTYASRPDLSKPSLEGLAWILRHQMPEGHRWDFTKVIYRESCGTAGCALGVARIVWPELKEMYWIEMLQALGTQAYFTAQLFSAGVDSARENYGVLPDAVTAAMVADKIDAHLRDRAALNAAAEVSFAPVKEKV